MTKFINYSEFISVNRFIEICDITDNVSIKESILREFSNYKDSYFYVDGIIGKQYLKGFFRLVKLSPEITNLKAVIHAHGNFQINNKPTTGKLEIEVNNFSKDSNCNTSTLSALRVKENFGYTITQSKLSGIVQAVTFPDIIITNIPDSWRFFCIEQLENYLLNYNIKWTKILSSYADIYNISKYKTKHKDYINRIEKSEKVLVPIQINNTSEQNQIDTSRYDNFAKRVIEFVIQKRNSKTQPLIKSALGKYFEENNLEELPLFKDLYSFLFEQSIETIVISEVSSDLIKLNDDSELTREQFRKGYYHMFKGFSNP